MAAEKRVFIAGAGPVGLTAAAVLVARSVPVTVLEGSLDLSRESRASTFHPPTLDMLAEIGATEALIAQGLITPRFQYRTRAGLIAAFDFAALEGLTKFPFRLQCEQFKLTRILHDMLSGDPNYRIEFGVAVRGVSQDMSGVTIDVVTAGGARETRRGSWLIGADGARSDVRNSLQIEFEGFTWPERFLVASTSYDFMSVISGLDRVSYVADPVRWHFYLQIPGGIWRMMFPVGTEVPEEEATSLAYANAALDSLLPGVSGYAIVHTTLYRVHQRVAKTFRDGRVFLAGDAAHVNNPLGGMGMNGGIHDAVNLAGRLARVWHDKAGESELDRYDRQRRLVTLEYVQKYTIENKRNLETADPAEQAQFRDMLQRIAADPDATRDYLKRVSMIASLDRAAELG